MKIAVLCIVTVMLLVIVQAAEVPLGRQARSADSTRPDKCSLPKDEGSGRQGHTRWYYDDDSGRCAQFTYRGAGGNENNFEDCFDCADTCDVADYDCYD